MTHHVGLKMIGVVSERFKKTFLEKEIMLLTSIFTFFNVFKRLASLVTKVRIQWYRVIHVFTLYPTILTFNTCGNKAFENIDGNRENADNQHFLLFPQCFLLFPTHISIIEAESFCRLQMLEIWASLKFCCLLES